MESREEIIKKMREMTDDQLVLAHECIDYLLHAEREDYFDYCSESDTHPAELEIAHIFVSGISAMYKDENTWRKTNFPLDEIRQYLPSNTERYIKTLNGKSEME